jgi:prevent-host-death family protein
MSVEEIGAYEAKTRLSELLDEVAQGRVYRITKRGRPVAELRPVEYTERRPAFGRDRGRIVISPDFDDPLDEFAPYR